MTLATTITAGVETTFQKTKGLGLATYPGLDVSVFSLTDGVGDYQADLEYFSTPPGRTLTTGASENIDLAGSLPDALGDLMTMLHVKVIKIVSDAANTTDLTIGGAASNAFVGPFGASTHTITLKPGETLLLTNRKVGWPVVAGTADLLKILNAAGASATYTLHIIGTST